MVEIRALLPLFALAALGAEEGLRIDLVADSTQIKVGDELTVRVTYRWPTGWRPLREPDPGPAFSGEYLVDLPPVRKGGDATGEWREFRLRLAARRSGAWALPRPILELDGPGGRISATAPAVVVQVGAEADPPRLPPPQGLLLRPPADLAPSDRRWWWTGGALAAAVAGTALALWLRRRHAVPPPSPAALFRDDLAGLAACTEGKEAGARVSLALRRYAGAVWRFDGPGSTTRETALALRRRKDQAPEPEALALVKLLERLDDLRWAAGDLPREAVLPLAEQARAWQGGVQARLDAEAAAAAQRQGKGPA